LHATVGFLEGLQSGRVYLYGYRVHEVDLTGLPDAKKSLKFGKARLSQAEYNSERTCLSTSLPLCFTGATPPRPDPGHPISSAAGIIKRFGYKPPVVNRHLKRNLKRFAALWCRHNLTPLTPADVPSFEEWLEDVPYSSARKDELKRVWDKEGRKPNKKLFETVKSFVKDETYPEYKFPRLINSRTDMAKCYFGPIVQAISDRVFESPWFIKKVPVADRPKVIRDTLLEQGAEYVFTDYTAFEAHFTAEVMEMVQFELFKYMLKGAHQEEWLDIYTSTMAGRNKITMKWFDVVIEACRMSGEMDTSLSNGFCNLILFLFLAHENGATAVAGFVEGDDGLFRVTPSNAAPTKQQFADLGFTIKIGTTPNLSEASFCGQVYDMDDLIVVTDPLEVLARVGWTNKKYTRCSHNTALQLLRAKGYSLAYQYNGCPVLSVLGRRLLSLTANVIISEKVGNNMDQWERSKLADAMNLLPEEKSIGSNTRALVEKLFGLTVAEQLRLEDWFSKIEFGLYELPGIDHVPNVWKHYYDVYSVDHLTNDPCWLVKPERSYIEPLTDRFVNLRPFITSLRVGWG